MPVSDISMAGRQPPHMGPVARGFAALGDMAERAVSTVAEIARMRRKLQAALVTPAPCSPAMGNLAVFGR